MLALVMADLVVGYHTRGYSNRQTAALFSRAVTQQRKRNRYVVTRILDHRDMINFSLLLEYPNEQVTYLVSGRHLDPGTEQIPCYRNSLW